MCIKPEYAEYKSLDTLETKRVLTGFTVCDDGKEIEVTHGMPGFRQIEECLTDMNEPIEEALETVRRMSRNVWYGANPKPLEGLQSYCTVVDEFAKENGDMKVRPKYVSNKDYVENYMTTVKGIANFIDSEKEKEKMQYDEIVSSYSKASLLKKGEVLFPEIVSSYSKASLLKKGEVLFPEIKKVHFSGPCTVVIWEDGTKTMVRCQEGDNFDPEKGLAMAIAKKALGNKGRYFDEIKRHMPPISPSEVCKEHLGAWSSLFQFTTVQETISKLEETISLLKKEIEE